MKKNVKKKVVKAPAQNPWGVVGSLIVMGLIIWGSMYLTNLSKNKMCSDDYEPVCGIDGVTYLNECVAKSVDIFRDGECGLVHKCSESELATDICTMDYSPVCGLNNKTYSNGCGACSSQETTAWVFGVC